MSSEICFNLDRKLDLASELARFSRYGDWQTDQKQSIQSTLYDTFDWRLHNAGRRLVTDKTSKFQHLVLTDINTSNLLHWTSIEEAPDFVSNLPPSQLKNVLRPLISVRRLLPLVDVKKRVETYSLLNDDRKIILRVQKFVSRAISPQTGKTKILAPGLRVQALKGYIKPFNEFSHFIRNELKLSQLNDSYDEAMAMHGIIPGSYSSKLEFKLDPNTRSDTSVIQFLAALFNTMESNEAGIEADLDSEFLHDFRVAGRRSRSAIGQIRHIMPAKTLDRLKRDFAWLNQVTGPGRDMDVYLLNYQKYQCCLPDEMQADLAPLQVFLRDHKNAEYKKLVRFLRSARYRNFKNFLRKYLEAPVVEHTTLAHAKQPIQEASSHRIWKIYHRVIKLGNAITNSSPNTELHELRKTCKKLRYLLEFCQSIYPKKEMNHLIKSLKQLQDILGEFQDYSIQIDSLQKFKQQMVEEKRTNERTLTAMNELVKILEGNQNEIRQVFHKQFRQFSTKENKGIFKQLFKPDTHKIEEKPIENLDSGPPIS